MIKTEFLLLILIFIIIYFSWKINCIEKKNIEHFTTTTTEEHIKRAVKQIYLADVEAIRILSNFAIQLSQGGTTISGNITFENGVIINNNATINGVATINGTSTISHTLTVNSDIIVNNGKLQIISKQTTPVTNPSLVLTNSNNKNWQISNIGGTENKLVFNIDNTPVLELYDNGKVKITGDLRVTGNITATGNATITGLTELNGGALITTQPTGTTISGNVTLNGRTKVSGVLSCDNNIITAKNLYYNLISGTYEKIMGVGDGSNNTKRPDNVWGLYSKTIDPAATVAALRSTEHQSFTGY